MTSLTRLVWKPRTAATNVLPVTEYLRALETFREVPRDELERFGRTLTMRERAPGTWFFEPRDASERLFILKDGEVDLYRLSRDGRRMVMARLRPMVMFGEMGLLGQTMHGCYAESVTPALVCVGTREEVVQLLRRHPDVALRLLAAVGTRLRAVEERMAGLALAPVQSRLATLLLSQMTPDSREVSGFTHAELGDMIGALRQTVTETLAAMQREGMVAVSHKHVRVLDDQRLRRMARGDE